MGLRPLLLLPLLAALLALASAADEASLSATSTDESLGPLMKALLPAAERQKRSPTFHKWKHFGGGGGCGGGCCSGNCGGTVYKEVPVYVVPVHVPSGGGGCRTGRCYQQPVCDTCGGGGGHGGGWSHATATAHASAGSW